jgi:hypothetical protein
VVDRKLQEEEEKGEEEGMKGDGTSAAIAKKMKKIERKTLP